MCGKPLTEDEACRADLKVTGKPGNQISKETGLDLCPTCTQKVWAFIEQRERGPGSEIIVTDVARTNGNSGRFDPPSDAPPISSDDQKLYDWLTQNTWGLPDWGDLDPQIKTVWLNTLNILRQVQAEATR